MRLTAAQARRLALGAQGFADPRPTRKVDVRHLRRVLGRTGLVQLDSVNVLVRSHYLPVFARLGGYGRDKLDRWLYRSGEMFEYWGHGTSVLPVGLHPLLRYRMRSWEPGPRTRRVMQEHPGYIESVLEEVARRGPLSVTDLEEPGRRSGPWWGLSKGRTALDWLFARGRLAVRERLPSFVLVYDLPERVLPREVLAAEDVPREEATRRLLLLAARCCGVGTAADLADYHRIPPGYARARLQELVEAGRLRPVEVEGWNDPAYLHPEATIPRRVTGRALLSPFDSLIWYRERAERLFGFHYRIEIYVPAERRRHGYYVLPFLLDDRLVARVDLKAERRERVLRVRGAYLEDGHEGPRVARELGAELRVMASWLGLEEVALEPRGDLAARLERTLAG
ncbi:MAG: winged helix-turn-helix domain-containing protein [Acidimicrobiia bacterium]